jgi:hypothetical protein
MDDWFTVKHVLTIITVKFTLVKKCFHAKRVITFSVVKITPVKTHDN